MADIRSLPHVDAPAHGMRCAWCQSPLGATRAALNRDEGPIFFCQMTSRARTSCLLEWKAQRRRSYGVDTAWVSDDGADSKLLTFAARPSRSARTSLSR